MDVIGNIDEDTFIKIYYCHDWKDKIILNSKLYNSYGHYSPISGTGCSMYAYSQRKFDKFKYMQSYLALTLYNYSEYEKSLNEIPIKDLVVIGEIPETLYDIRSSEEAIKKLDEITNGLTDIVKECDACIYGLVIAYALDPSLPEFPDNEMINVGISEKDLQKFLVHFDDIVYHKDYSDSINRVTGYWKGRQINISVTSKLCGFIFNIKNIILNIPIEEGCFRRYGLEISLKQYVAIRTKRIYEYRWLGNFTELKPLIERYSNYEFYIPRCMMEKFGNMENTKLIEMFENDYFKNGESCVLPKMKKSEIEDIKSVYESLRNGLMALGEI
jgi:hypothetical protein